MVLGTHGSIVRVKKAVSDHHSSSYTFYSTDYPLLVSARGPWSQGNKLYFPAPKTEENQLC